MNNVRLLLSYRAALITKDIAGLTAYDIAENGEHPECVQLLKETAGKQCDIVLRLIYGILVVHNTLPGVLVLI